VSDALVERLRVVRVLTVGFGVGFLVVRLPHLLALAHYDADRFEPVGILRRLDRPFDPLLWKMLVLCAIPLGGAFAAGWWMRVTGPAFAAGLLVITTYRSSWAHLSHADNLFVLHVALLAVAFALPRRRPADVLRLLQLVTVTTYVVSGVAKLRETGFDWVTGDVLRDQIAYDNVRKAVLGAPYSPLARHVVGHSRLLLVAALAALLVELCAPVSLLGARWGARWALAAWLFHVGVVALMAIVFPYQLSGIAYASMLPVERLSQRAVRWRRALRSSAASG
jgi:hypothetical protein